MNRTASRRTPRHGVGRGPVPGRQRVGWRAPQAARESRHRVIACRVQADGLRLRLPENDYGHGSPFPHVIIDDLLAQQQVAAAVDSFPSISWPGSKRYEGAFQPNRSACSAIAVVRRPRQRQIEALNHPLKLLEEMPGIGDAILHAYLEGGGLHRTGPGGTLTPHTGFRLYPRLNLYRGLNAILYLNPGWTVGDCGDLELFELGSDTITVRIRPILGRLVVFQTDHRSLHEFTNPIRRGTIRRSIATYSYTATEADRFSGDTTTYCLMHGNGRALHRSRMTAYRSLSFGSRALSWPAHRANPNLGRNVRAQ